MLFRSTAASLATVAGEPALAPISLMRREPPHPALPFAASGGQILFQPSAASAWKTLPGLQELSRTDGVIDLQVTAPEAAFEFALTKPLVAATNQLLAIQLQNGTSAGLARVFWAGVGEAFDPARSAWIPLVANDSELREYHCSLGLENSWRGSITRIRIEPATGLTERGTIKLGQIRWLKSPPVSRRSNL